MTPADAELVELLRGWLDVWEKSDAGSQECAQAYMHILAKGLSAARLLIAQSAEIARLREALSPFSKLADKWPADDWNEDDEVYGSAVPTVGDLRRARATLERWGLK